MCFTAHDKLPKGIYVIKNSLKLCPWSWTNKYNLCHKLDDGSGSPMVSHNQGPVSILRPSFPGMRIPMLKIRRSRDCLIFNMGIPILVRRHFDIETAPWCSKQTISQNDECCFDPRNCDTTKLHRGAHQVWWNIYQRFTVIGICVLGEF